MYTFKKEERLCSKKLIEELFHNGSSFLLYPFRIVWLKQAFPANVPVQVVINVPKRRFKRAVDRNLIKRRIRESYRLNKSEELYVFLEEHSSQLLLAFQYVGKEIAQFEMINKKLKLVLNQLKEAYLKNHTEIK
ncbi:ribonuclease P protein component [Flavihumibacter sp. R14]|nr:ribonuclease P protein component [Flavihumibacter soli]